jgi:hypothetical protein
MAHVYITTLKKGLMEELAGELLGDGVAAGRIRVVSAYPERVPRLPVKLIRYRSPASSAMVGAALGAVAGALLGMPLLAFGVFAIAPLLVIVVVAATAGAVFRLWFATSPSGEIYRLDEALRSGEDVMVLDIEEGRIGELERKVKSRHPEVAVLGTDPGGTPPFP